MTYYFVGFGDTGSIKPQPKAKNQALRRLYQQKHPSCFSEDNGPSLLYVNNIRAAYRKLTAPESLNPKL